MTDISLTDIIMAPHNPRDPLTPATLHILLSLAQDPLHGYAIKSEIERRTEGRLTLGPGTLYEAIHRMHEDGWIEELSAEGRRRVYTVTARGRSVLDDELRRLDEIVDFARTADLYPCRRPA